MPYSTSSRINRFHPIFFGRLIVIILMTWMGLSTALAQAENKLGGKAKSLQQITQGLKKYSGFFNFYWDENKGKIWLEIERLDEPFLYAHYLKTGVGSNDIGLDRGQAANEKMVKFIRLGHRVLLVQPNLRYRAISDNPMEVKAVEDAFAQSAIWGGEVAATQGSRILVDITSLLVSDSHQIANRLKQMNQGDYKFDAKRSAINPATNRSFPDNSEFEALITLQGKKPGQLISSVTPSPESLTVSVRHSFIRLPDENYQTRAFDPRSGAIYITFEDYAAPLDQSLTKQLITRHRLQKINPQQAVSDVFEPIVYYLDPGTPEPIRSALLDGARWWAEGFQALGFRNAFEVKMLPADADPLDIRYNTIQWVHRSTRGWSYGYSIVDPRTGEIIKGHVTLGSLRVRQDMLIAQGLLSPYLTGNEKPKQMQEMALARLRQLSAHEIGHTLGLIHNFQSSANDRSSVMDYPHPLITINQQGELELTQAYSVGLGSWDKVSLAFLYSEFADNENEAAELDKLLQNATQQGHVFIADRDARTAGGSHPTAHLWDNEADPIKGLENVLAIRAKALNDFGLNTIPNGSSLFSLEQILAPIFLFHRYQTEAVVKLIAGVDYEYALRSKNESKARIVDPLVQKNALRALMQTIQADQLAIPEKTLELLLPPVAGSARNREHFKHRTGLNFDALAAAEMAARLSVSLLLNPQRAARLIEQNARNESVPGLKGVLEDLINNSWGIDQKDRYLSEVQRSINWVVLQELMLLADHAEASPQVKAIATHSLTELNKRLKKTTNGNNMDSILAQQARREINAFLENKKDSKPAEKRIQPPPGSPIGG